MLNSLKQSPIFQSDHSLSSKVQLIIGLGGALAYLIVSLLLMPTFQVGTYQDDALYINLAHALATGHGYVDLMHVGNPPHTFVPPVYPALLAPTVFLFDYDWLLTNNFWPLQLISILFVLSGLVCFAIILRQRQVPQWGVLFALATLIPITIGMSWHVMAEAPYFFFSLAALAALVIWARRQDAQYWLVIAVICAILASLTRLVGLAVIAAMAIYLWRRLSLVRWLTVLTGLLIPLGIWFLRNTVLGTAVTGEYATSGLPTSGSAFILSFVPNLALIVSDLVPGTLIPGLTGPQTIEMLSRWGIGFIPYGIGFFLFLIISIGYIQSLRDCADTQVVELYIACYFGILLITQFTLLGGARYLAPIFVFLLLYFWQGMWGVLKSAERFIQPLPGAKLMTIMAIFMLMSYLARDVQAIVRPVRERLPDVRLGTLWLNHNTPDDMVVMATNPRTVYLYSQRKVMPYPVTADETSVSVVQQIICSPADYVLVRPELKPGTFPQWSETTEQVIVPILDNHPEFFAMQYMSEDSLARVYEITGQRNQKCE